MLDKGKIWLNLCDFECCVRKKADRPLMKQNFFFLKHVKYVKWRHLKYYNIWFII